VPVFAAFLTTVLFSLSAICGHRSVRLIGGTEANFWRITFATFFLWIWSFFFGQGLQGSALLIFLFSGVLGIGLGDVAYFQALPRLGPRLTLLIVQCLTAPFGALIEWIWLGTTLTAAQVLCAAIILGGVGIALAPDKHLSLTRKQWSIGIVAGVIAALGGAGGAVLSRRAYSALQSIGETVHPMDAGFQRVLGGCIISAISLLIVKSRLVKQELGDASLRVTEETRNKWRRVWFWIVLNSLAGQTLGVSCMQKAFETTPTGIVLPIIATAPIVVIPMAYLFEGERPSVRSVVGGVIAVLGVIALVRFGN